MIRYIGLAVQIHGLDVPKAEAIRERVEALLRDDFDPDSSSDIVVDVDEYAGTEET